VRGLRVARASRPWPVGAHGCAPMWVVYPWSAEAELQPLPKAEQSSCRLGSFTILYPLFPFPPGEGLGEGPSRRTGVPPVVRKGARLCAHVTALFRVPFVTS